MPLSDDAFLPPLLAPDSGALLLYRLHESALVDDGPPACRRDDEHRVGRAATEPMRAARAAG